MEAKYLATLVTASLRKDKIRICSPDHKTGGKSIILMSDHDLPEEQVSLAAALRYVDYVECPRDL